jgi:hypothetical protein
MPRSQTPSDRSSRSLPSAPPGPCMPLGSVLASDTHKSTYQACKASSVSKRNDYNLIASYLDFGDINYCIRLSTNKLHFCDCCDGSDEYDTQAIVNCTNYCNQIIADRRIEALNMFRSVQAGRRARSELLQADRRNRLLELKNYESLLEERTTMSGLYVQIKSWQLREDRLENQFRVKIIRERESRCGFGEDEACDLFYQGWLPTDTIATEGTETMFANPKYVPHFYPPNELIQEQRKHTGLARVRLSLCMEHDLQPDENLRVFDTFGQYEEFYTGMGSKQYMRKTVKQMRKSSLFGPYLEHGHRGYMEGCAVVTELLGLLVSPITVPLQLGYLGAETALEKFWGTLERCVSNEEGNGAIRSICSVLIRMYDVAGVPQQVSNALDITMLNDLQEYIFERLNPFITPPIWIASVMWNTPRMYYNYYWLDLTRQLPVRRDSCLLRSAEESSEWGLATRKAHI